ncbi:hypothetical protein SK128_004036, partial [Halocaridina rubra]
MRSRWAWALLGFLGIFKVICAQSYISECETLPSTIHITKEEYDEAGRLVRNCEEDLAVNKCEGACLSKVQPSVNTPSGFLK